MMTKNNRIVVGNWKMYLTYNQAQEWLDNHFNDLVALASETDNEIALCPSFDALPSFCKGFADSRIAVGAQDCSRNASGAYTGETSARSIMELGCTYSIVGHSERRTYNRETSEIVAQKAHMAFYADITPIVCIGETHEERDAGNTQKVLESQLTPVISMLNVNDITKPFCIAYEPVWAIGSGRTATIEQLNETFGIIASALKNTPSSSSIRLLYGGSVNGTSAPELAKTSMLSGFLVGKASTDFQELKKIVLSI